MKWLFVNDFSMVDTLFLSVASHALSRGDVLNSAIISFVGLTIHMTIGRKYNAPSA